MSFCESSPLSRANAFITQQNRKRLKKLAVLVIQEAQVTLSNPTHVFQPPMFSNICKTPLVRNDHRLRRMFRRHLAEIRTISQKLSDLGEQLTYPEVLDGKAEPSQRRTINEKYLEADYITDRGVLYPFMISPQKCDSPYRVISI